jgi:hypothetical protein
MRTFAIVVLAVTTLLGACERRQEPSANGTDAAATQSGQSTPPGKSIGSSSPERLGGEAAAVAESSSTAKPPSSSTGAATPVSPTASAASVDSSAESGREVTLPAGARLPLVLDTPVASDTSRVEQAVHAHLARPVVVKGVTVLPTGSVVSGVVTSAVRSGKVKGRAHVAVKFDSVSRRGDSERYRMSATSLSQTAPPTKKNDTLKVVAPAAGGAIIGRIAGGRKGALIGTAAGAGAGGAVVMSTRGEEVRLGKGAAVTIRLSAPLTIRVPRG